MSLRFHGTPPQLVIDDRDMCSDWDDILASALMWGAVQTGNIQVIATGANTTNLYTAPLMRVFSTYMGYPTVPIGTYKTGHTYTITGGNQNSGYTQPTAAAFGRGSDTSANYPDAVSVYRQAMVSNRNILFSCSGGLTNLANTLASGADGISPLTGMQLFAQSVSSCSIMGGAINTGASEYNIVTDPVGAAYFYPNCPVPILSFSNPNGTSIGMVGVANTTNEATNPFENALFQISETEEFAWDHGQMYVALFGGIGTLFSYGGQNGTATINGSNNLVWSASAGQTSWLNLLASAATIRAAIAAKIAVTCPP